MILSNQSLCVIFHSGWECFWILLWMFPLWHYLVRHSEISRIVDSPRDSRYKPAPNGMLFLLQKITLFHFVSIVRQFYLFNYGCEILIMKNLCVPQIRYLLTTRNKRINLGKVQLLWFQYLMRKFIKWKNDLDIWAICETKNTKRLHKINVNVYITWLVISKEFCSGKERKNCSNTDVNVCL